MKKFKIENGGGLLTAEYKLTEECEGSVIDDRIRYALYKKDDAWYIRVDLCEDYAVYSVGSDEKMAKWLFFVIVDGGVTPCTLKCIADEVVDDYIEKDFTKLK